MKDVTLGQYYPADSALHRADPRAKLIATALMMVAVFAANTWQGYAAVAVMILLGIGVSRAPFKSVLKSLRPIFFIVAFTFVINIFFMQGGKLLWQWWIFRVYEQGILNAVQMVIRIVLLVMGTTILTLTTSPLDLTDGLERVLLPLKWLRFPIHELSMMMSIAMRFIPTLSQEADRIRKAQLARGADFDSGGLIKRAKGMIPLLVPLFVGAFRRADELAMAMESRCYTGGKGRTRMKILHMDARDCALLLGLCGMCIILTAGGW